MKNSLTEQHTTISVGVDVSKAQLDVDHHANRSQFPNTPAGFRRLYRTLKTVPLKLVCLEATGGYEKPLVKWLHERNVPVAVVNHRQTTFTRNNNLTNKTVATRLRAPLSTTASTDTSIGTRAPI